MKKYYCIKCRRKLVVNSYSTWNPELPQKLRENLYANFTAWTCDHCNIAFIFVNTSGNENTVLTLINLNGYLREIVPCHICGSKEDVSDVFDKDRILRSGCSKCYG